MKYAGKIWISALFLAGGLLGIESKAVMADSSTAAAGAARLMAAKKEGRLLIYASIGKTTGERLVSEFGRLYPEIQVELMEMDGPELFNRHMNDLGARKASADLLWSRNFELQAALIKDGYALPYHSPVSTEIFSWANIGNSSYATGFEPVAMVYNKKLQGPADYPATRSALLKAAGELPLKGKIATCDPEKNYLALQLLTSDQRQGSFWKMVKGFGDSGLQMYPDYSGLLDKVSSGVALFGYNVPASAAFNRSRIDPAIGYFYPSDYTLALLQVALITTAAVHPNAAGIWIDFILSKEGQTIIANGSDLFPIRGDVSGGAITRDAAKLPGARNLRPVLPDDEANRFNDKGLRRGFLLRWKQKLKLVK